MCPVTITTISSLYPLNSVASDLNIICISAHDWLKMWIIFSDITYQAPQSPASN